LQAITGEAKRTMEKNERKIVMMKDRKSQQLHQCRGPNKCGNQGIDRQCNDLAAKS
jgi:hypothetical protein